MTPDTLVSRHRATLRAVAVAFVPELTQADAAAWLEVEATVAHAVSLRPRRQRRQLALLLRLIGVLGRLRFGRSLATLEPARRERFLLALQRAPFLLIRRGIWGLRTLVLLGHYTRPDVTRALGYRADARGWSAREPAAPAERE